MSIKKIIGWAIISILLLGPRVYLDYVHQSWWIGFAILAVAYAIGVTICILLNIILNKCFKN